jgi:hypothetical protein
VATNHLTLAFPMKSPADAKAVTERLPPMMPEFFNGLDVIGTVHYSRFTLLSDKTLLYLADFDGEFAELMRAMSGPGGSVFDAIFEHVANPPPIPIVGNADAFVEWTAGQLLHPVVTYSAYPGVTVKEIKSLAAAAGVSGAGEVRPFLVVLPAKSRIAYIEMQLLIRALSRKAQRDLEKVGTPHMVQFVPLGNEQTGFFTAYDGSFDTYIADFTRTIGEVFDLLFKFTKGAPPSPCRKYLQEFVDFATAANRDPIGFYQAYPGLSNQDIRALLADAKAEAALAE